jgi:hypothetical protein
MPWNKDYNISCPAGLQCNAQERRSEVLIGGYTKIT